MLYPAKISIRIKGQIKSFPDKKNQRSLSSPNNYCMKFSRNLLKKKIKTMNNKMAVHIYQQLNLTDKKNRDRIVDKVSILRVATWEEDVGEYVTR